MTTVSERVKKSSVSPPSKWPFLYSVDIQTSLMYLLTVYVSLLAPFSDSSQENEHLNFIHDFLYEQLDRVQLTNAKFSSFVLLGLIFGPIKFLIKRISTTISPIKVLLIMRIIINLISVSCWRLLQKRISYNFGSRVAFLFFLSEIFNWTCLHQYSRFSENNILRSLVLLSFGLLIERKYLFSLSLICLTLPILKENSLNLLSSLLPLFLNREIFEKDSFAMFSYLSISGIVIAINPKDPYMITDANLSILKTPIALMSAVTMISGLITKNILVLKFSAVHLIGSILFEQKLMVETIYFPFIAVAFALSYSQMLASRKQNGQHTLMIHPQLESTALHLVSIFLAFFFAKNCLKSVELSSGGHAALKLNDFLIAESMTCPGIIKAHISKSAQALGISKFSMLRNPNISYEFGTIYDDREMLQKFKYRVADINENVDPAYWRVRTVFTGISGINDKNSKLQIKIMTRTQAAD